jgi:transposase
MKNTTIAGDLAKSVFHVAVSHTPGRVDAARRLSREKFLEYLATQPPATVLLEACGSAHHWARPLQPFGHAVRLLPAHDVHRYVRRRKTDRTDAKAWWEADRHEEIHAVPVTTIEPQSIAALHRMRSTWLATRTARIKTVRGLRRECGLVIPVGAQPVVPQVRELLASSAQHGASNSTAFQRWARTLQTRRGHNVAAVAVANRLARIIWAVWTRQQPFAADYRPTRTTPSIPTAHPETCTESE